MLMVVSVHTGSCTLTYEIYGPTGLTASPKTGRVVWSQPWARFVGPNKQIEF